MYAVTFYSFKGGVGRTHAAVNIALAMATSRLRVLLVDFDLEAPGLSSLSVLAPPGARPHSGLVEFIADSWQTRQTQDPAAYIYEPKGFEQSLGVMPAGAMGSPNFPRAFRDTKTFFEGAFDKAKGMPGLALFADLKRAWASLGYDYVIVDSRTGFTDTGGVCTRLIPDMLVVIFGLGEQGLPGVRRVLEQVGHETLYGDSIEVRLVASMLPAGELEQRDARLKIVGRVLGRQPDMLLPLVDRLLLKEDPGHFEDSLSPLGAAYRALVESIRQANRWDVHYRLAQAQQKAAVTDLGPLENLVDDLSGADSDQLPEETRWATLNQAATALIHAPAGTIEAKVRAVRAGTTALRLALARLDRYGNRELYGATLNSLAIALEASPARSPDERAANLREAIATFREALTVYTKDRYPDKWAGILNNLANVLQGLPGSPDQRAANLKEAVDAFRGALTVYTKERNPVEWAMTLTNLAAALQDLPTGSPDERAAALREAVAASHEALTVYTKDGYPVEWAGILNNLAGALKALPARSPDERAAALREAVAACREALTVYTKDRYPVERATTLNNLGNALEALPARSPDERAAALDEAIGAFREALTVYTKDRYPVEWATTLNNLGYALLGSAARSPEERTAALREAIGAFRDVLTVQTKDGYPFEWAMTLGNLAAALQALSATSPDERAAALREAITAYREALNVYTKDRHPVEWAATLINLAGVLQALPTRSPDERAVALREAIAAYRDALTVLTKDRHPDKYAKIAANLGSLLIESGDIAEGQRYLESALALREFLLDQGSAIESWLRQRG